MQIAQYLASCEAQYNPAERMLRQAFKGPGYHTAVPDGTLVHATRESLHYALALLASPEVTHQQRAAQVIMRVVALQDTDPASATYGIWSWLLEEPLAQMQPPDWNWADFLGATLATILIDHADKLPAHVCDAIRASLRHAAASIVRRNVEVSYTNIAIMGAGVTLATGELLADAEYVAYGRDRLRRVREHTAVHGDFNEYNSPTYTAVALEELERILHLVRDAEAREHAEVLRYHAWRVIAEHYHPATGQWAGPMSRAYADVLLETVAAKLARLAGATATVQTEHGVRSAAQLLAEAPPPLFAELPCPDELRPRFLALPSAPCQIRRQFIQGDDDIAATSGTTWFTTQACLGSANRAVSWTQRRPLLAYWTLGDGLTAVLRLRVLRDGQDFASAELRTAQEGPRALTDVQFVTGGGISHPFFGRPEDGRYPCADLRVRYELTGRGAQAEQQDDGSVVLQAGAWRAIIYPLPACFGAQQLAWTVGREDDRVYLDAVCYAGPTQAFDFSALAPVRLAAGVELLPVSAAPLGIFPQGHDTAAQWTLGWAAAGALSVTVPLRGDTFHF
ncbi:MAG TPA: hypothetical protein VGL77_14520 [Armatimonadota bacterium]|jgi:hypothetical protein